MADLADLLLETRPDALNTGPDFHYNVNDAIDILPKLQTGLDVNVRHVLCTIVLDIYLYYVVAGFIPVSTLKVYFGGM